MAKGAPLGEVQEQSVAQRRALRGKYRLLFDDIGGAGKENINGEQQLQGMLAKVQALHTQVERPREHAVDAEVFAQLAECGLALIQRGRAANQGRTPADLVRALRCRFTMDAFADTATLPDASAFDWAELGAGVSSLLPGAPGVSCMLGPLTAQARVRRTAVRTVRQHAAPAEAPAELQHIHEADKQETDRHMENMWRLLSRLGSAQDVPLVRLVLNHASFAQTVENIFTLSFLVRDQRVRLRHDPDRGLSVRPVSKAERDAATAQQQQQQPGASGRAQQFMLDFSMRDWLQMKALVPAGECLMPHRAAQAAQQMQTQQQQQQTQGSSRARPAAAAAGGASKRTRTSC